MLNFCDFIQVYVFSTNHHLKYSIFIGQGRLHTDSVNACLQQLLLFGTIAWDNPQILNVTLALP